MARHRYAPTATMGFTRTLARLTATTGQNISTAASSSAPVRGSDLEAVDLDATLMGAVGSVEAAISMAGDAASTDAVDAASMATDAVGLTVVDAASMAMGAVAPDSTARLTAADADPPAVDSAVAVGRAVEAVSTVAACPTAAVLTVGAVLTVAADTDNFQ
jgi:hypothetical protein